MSVAVHASVRCLIELLTAAVALRCSLLALIAQHEATVMMPCLLHYHVKTKV